MSRLASLSLLTLIAAVSGGAPQAAAPSVGVDVSNMDQQVKPGDDFFAYANGGWLKRTSIPNDQGRWSSFAELDEVARQRTRELLEQAQSATDKTERKAADYYSALLNESAIEAKGYAPLEQDIAAIAAIANLSDLSLAIGKSVRADVDPLNNTNFNTQNLFGIWVAPGFDDSSHYMPFLLQGGLGMPARQYYLDDSAKMQAARVAYQAYVAKVLSLTGVPGAQQKAAAVMALEVQIAKAQLSLVDNNDVVKAHNVWRQSDFAVKAPGIEWIQFFAGAQLTNSPSFDVWQPSAFTKLSALVASQPLDTWKAWLTFHLINHFQQDLPKALQDANFAFYGTTLSGTPEQEARWKRAVRATNGQLGDAVGKLYIAKYFPPAAKAKAQQMVKNILQAWRRRLDALQWMAPTTKAEAQKKLSTLYVGIGYPESWRSLAALKIVKDDPLGNDSRADLFWYHYSIDRIGKPVNKHEWCMEPQTVNAVNLPTQNALNFPAAILQSPFFDADANDAFNYGAIGVVIGHEISHSFDASGAEFDAEGRLRNWWTKEDFEHFQAAGKALIAQYDQYHPLPDVAVNGAQTLDENIADNAGIFASYDAWHASLGGKAAPVDNGLTGEQQFFLAFAQEYRSKSRDETARRLVLQDTHAPAQFRALEVRNVDGWFAAFDVKPALKEYLAPEQRVHVW